MEIMVDRGMSLFPAHFSFLPLTAATCRAHIPHEVYFCWTFQLNFPAELPSWTSSRLFLQWLFNEDCNVYTLKCSLFKDVSTVYVGTRHLWICAFKRNFVSCESFFWLLFLLKSIESRGHNPFIATKLANLATKLSFGGLMTDENLFLLFAEMVKDCSKVNLVYWHDCVSVTRRRLTDEAL